MSLAAWVEVNKKRLAIGAGVAMLALIVGGAFIQHQAHKEEAASEALSEVKLPFNPAAPVAPGTANALLKLANEHKGTKAAARALLISAGILFAENDYSEAQKRFDQVARDYADSQWVAQAALGTAACLDAQGKSAEALAKYEEIRRKHGSSPVIDETKLALARLYETQKPEEAFKLYEELVKSNPNSGLAMEAGLRQEDLQKKHPELAKLKEPIMPAVTSPVIMTNPPIKMAPVTNRPGTSQPMRINLSSNPAPKIGPSAPTPPPAPAPAPAPAK